ncbi:MULTISPECIES: cation:dicarboxylate symporter family transporter [unclassified Pseudoclavibacter]|uniref:cation:dicarboxylate symporter family transporter n=1 Tax=unclassified Pseudoclavibacter TaxID=2615177 RepID=UPI001300F794|nr:MULTISPECIES: cation:dicarboxylase symporter family transporter [unclassified Pseudoclavibacter]KAB1645723.1 cation:dicarboxylase symporter family transporter [Pseudoclavibacter sp. CFCC 14310]KAB1658666.1 cation:dicarboxylase symporter family transporter [Pseudoclavibacter sp. CFCC 11306]KAB1661273.1 cation:dicarboxylase symporter family transporter [Pseudoclavibacter sp. CFCC 13796]KAB1664368.1 cation:dicarboxylase symporter family transporter [Pseudoclavibacter sp. CFCC 13611]
MNTQIDKSKGGVDRPKQKKPKTTWLYVLVIVAAVLGIVFGFVAPHAAVAMKPLATGFVSLIKMMIVPIIFCTIVLGIGSIAKAATVGKIGGLALGYFIIMSVVALAIGLVVGNIIKPGTGLDVSELLANPAKIPGASGEATNLTDFILSIIPASLVEPFASGNVLPGLFVALLTGFALQGMGSAAEPILKAIGAIQKVVFRILSMIMWVAPIGAFGGLAALIGATGWGGLGSLVSVMVGFYVTCALFVFVILGAILWLVARVNVFSFLKYLGKEFLLILATSSSESALPRLIGKMEHLGVDKAVVGITVPTGYSFNLDGTAIYLTMSSLFIADAMGNPMSIQEQIGLLLFMMIASKGAAGVSGAGIATLAGGLQAARPDLVNGVSIVVGIDRFMSEARALTNFAGNAIATVLVGTWTKEIDHEQVKKVLSGKDPFDEANFDGGH